MLNERLSFGSNMTIWCLEDAGEYSLQYLPNFKKEEISNVIDNFITQLEQYDTNIMPGAIDVINNMKNIKSFMMTASDSIINPETFKKNRLLDKIRGKDFLDYFPEHENMKGYINDE
jgi:hypothetical protein